MEDEVLYARKILEEDPEQVQIWENGTPSQRILARGIKHMARTNARSNESSKTSKSGKMSPRELARYVFVSTDEYAIIKIKKENKDEILKLREFEASLYENHIRQLDTEEYIEYLEQLLREDSHYWMKKFTKSLICSRQCLLLCHEIVDSSRKRVHKSRNVMELQDSLQEDKKLDAKLYDEFNNSKYITSDSAVSMLTKGYWEKNKRKG